MNFSSLKTKKEKKKKMVRQLVKKINLNKTEEGNSKMFHCFYISGFMKYKNRSNEGVL